MNPDVLYKRGVAKNFLLEILKEDNFLEDFKRMTQIELTMMLNQGFSSVIIEVLMLDKPEMLIQVYENITPEGAAHMIANELWEDLNGVKRYSPKTLTEAVDLLIKLIPPDSKQKLATLNESDLEKEHMGLGLWVRNNFSLWKDNQDLIKSCEAIDADSASAVIIKTAWSKLRSK